MIQFELSSLTVILGIVSLIGAIFGVFLYFKNPQIASEKETISLRQDITNLKGEIKEIKETHLRTLEGEIKTLNTNVSELSRTVVKLATIIDERIPRGQASLTPPGR